MHEYCLRRLHAYWARATSAVICNVMEMYLLVTSLVNHTKLPLTELFTLLIFFHLNCTAVKENKVDSAFLR